MNATEKFHIYKKQW